MVPNFVGFKRLPDIAPREYTNEAGILIKQYGVRGCAIMVVASPETNETIGYYISEADGWPAEEAAADLLRDDDGNPVVLDGKQWVYTEVPHTEDGELTVDQMAEKM